MSNGSLPRISIDLTPPAPTSVMARSTQQLKRIRFGSPTPLKRLPYHLWRWVLYLAAPRKGVSATHRWCRVLELVVRRTCKPDTREVVPNVFLSVADRAAFDLCVRRLGSKERAIERHNALTDGTSWLTLIARLVAEGRRRSRRRMSHVVKCAKCGVRAGRQQVFVPYWKFKMAVKRNADGPVPHPSLDDTVFCSVQCAEAQIGPSIWKQHCGACGKNRVRLVTRMREV